MKVRVHPGDQRGVGYVRMVWPAQAARTEGLDIEVAPNLPILRMPHVRGTLVKPGEIDGDVLVFQRPSHPELVALIPALQARGHAVVVDVDDDIASVPLRNAAYGFENHHRILKACAAADLVTVTTPSLARRYASHGRVAVIPNCVPDALQYLPRDSNGRTIGWAGWAGSHPDDLEVTRGGVQQALDDTGASFKVIGPADDVQRRLTLAHEPAATGPLTNVAGYEFERALGQLDVGIVPLADSTFNQSKSWLKGLQYAARGVAFVASPLPEYQRLASEGAGLLAAGRSRNWRSQLSRLIREPALRDELAAAGREVAARWTFETNGWRWAEAWHAAREHHQHASRKAVTA